MSTPEEPLAKLKRLLRHKRTSNKIVLYSDPGRPSGNVEMIDELEEVYGMSESMAVVRGRAQTILINTNWVTREDDYTAYQLKCPVDHQSLIVTIPGYTVVHCTCGRHR